MDTLPLPPRPSLEHYRKRAKDLVKAAGSNEQDAVRNWVAEWLDALARLRQETVSPFVQASYDRAVEQIEQHARESGGTFTLADAQFTIARAHGFRSWRDFAGHVERLSRTVADPFESAADAVVSGDLATLEALIRSHRDLIRARSAREHDVTLLHYVAANGVEDFRQLTPPNAVAARRPS